MKIKDLPDSSKPRERFLKHGPEVLSDSELFAIILRTGMAGENVMEVSNKLISKFGLVNLFECSLKELQEIKGIGPNKAMQILAMAELGKRYDQEKNSVNKITKAEDVFKLFHRRLRDKKQEHFYVLLLNNQNHIIKEELISKGVLDAAIIHPREIFKSAIKNSCAKILLVHNHPSGNANPSEEDLDITKKIIEVGKQVDIKVLDHVIIGDNSWWSWLEDDKI
ncbi:MAG: DNA repair protein RadC [Candidatus Pacearchaeota archaeon]